MIDYTLNRLKERSTWIGIGGILAATHYWFTDIQFDAFITMLTGITGFIATIAPDAKPSTDTKLPPSKK